MDIKFKKFSESAVTPTRGTDGSAGLDLYVDCADKIVIYPHQTMMFQTNIGMEIPEGYFGAVYPRSGISSKKSLRIANCVGVIDSDYRGSIGIPLHNDSDTARTIEPYERVAQIVIQKYEPVELVEVSDLSETERGAGGFGSTGKR